MHFAQGAFMFKIYLVYSSNTCTSISPPIQKSVATTLATLSKWTAAPPQATIVIFTDYPARKYNKKIGFQGNSLPKWIPLLQGKHS